MLFLPLSDNASHDLGFVENSPLRLDLDSILYTKNIFDLEQIIGPEEHAHPVKRS